MCCQKVELFLIYIYICCVAQFGFKKYMTSYLYISGILQPFNLHKKVRYFRNIISKEMVT